MNAISLFPFRPLRVAGVCGLLTLAGAGWGWGRWRAQFDQTFVASLHAPLNAHREPTEAVSVADWQSVPWKIFSGQSERDAKGRLSQRFRLAGTFLVYHGDLTDSRRAILDDLSSRAQVIVSEGEGILEGRVIRIYRDHVVAVFPEGEESLWLGGGMAGRTEGNGGGTVSKPEASAEGATPANDRFGGRQTAEGRWEYQRDRLLAYYAELRDEPERLLSVFDSLKPLYDEQRRITGYHLDVAGEAEFFKSVGLRQGDAVRAVNSMPMTNRKRAEYFITEFINDRASAFVLDIERDGRRQKLVYEIR